MGVMPTGSQQSGTNSNYNDELSDHAKIWDDDDESRLKCVRLRLLGSAVVETRRKPKWLYILSEVMCSNNEGVPKGGTPSQKIGMHVIQKLGECSIQSKFVLPAQWFNPPRQMNMWSRGPESKLD